MQFFLGYIFLAPLGWLILIIKHRDREKVKAIVKSDYDNRYSLVAGNFIFNFIIILFIILVIIMMLVAVLSPHFGEEVIEL